MLQVTSNFALPISQAKYRLRSMAECLVGKALSRTRALSAAERNADQTKLPSLSSCHQEGWKARKGHQALPSCLSHPRTGQWLCLPPTPGQLVLTWVQTEQHKTAGRVLTAVSLCVFFFPLLCSTWSFQHAGQPQWPCRASLHTSWEMLAVLI